MVSKASCVALLSPCVCSISNKYLVGIQGIIDVLTFGVSYKKMGAKRNVSAYCAFTRLNCKHNAIVLCKVHSFKIHTLFP